MSAKTLSKKDIDIWFYVYNLLKEKDEYLCGLNYETQSDGIHIYAFNDSFEQTNLCITLEDLKNERQKTKRITTSQIK